LNKLIKTIDKKINITTNHNIKRTHQPSYAPTAATQDEEKTP
jgi:hypothetical protein